MSDAMSNTTAAQTDTAKTKLQKKLGKDAAAEIEAKSKDDLRAHLVALALYEAELIEARDTDTALTEASEMVAALKAPHADAIKGNTLRRKYAAMCLDEAG